MSVAEHECVYLAGHCMYCGLPKWATTLPAPSTPPPSETHVFEAVGGEFPNTCRLCACFRESANHATPPPSADDRALSSYALSEYGGDARLYNGIHDMEAEIARLRAENDDLIVRLNVSRSIKPNEWLTAEKHSAQAAEERVRNDNYRLQDENARLTRERDEALAELAAESERLDKLQAFVDTQGPLILHNGEYRSSPSTCSYSGLGLRNTDRTLRSALDSWTDGLFAARKERG